MWPHTAEWAPSTGTRQARPLPCWCGTPVGRWAGCRLDRVGPEGLWQPAGRRRSDAACAASSPASQAPPLSSRPCRTPHLRCRPRAVLRRGPPANAGTAVGEEVRRAGQGCYSRGCVAGTHPAGWAWSRRAESVCRCSGTRARQRIARVAGSAAARSQQAHNRPARRARHLCRGGMGAAPTRSAAATQASERPSRRLSESPSGPREPNGRLG